MPDSKLKRALSEVLTKEYALMIPEHNSDHQFSPKFVKQMNKLIRRQKKPYYKMINTAAKRAACIALVVLAAAFTTVMSVDALRNAFKDFFMRMFSTHSVVTSVDDSNENAPQKIESNYDITYDLSGYIVENEYSDDVFRQINYNNGETNIDYYQYVKAEFTMWMNTEGAEVSAVDVNGHEAVYYTDSHNYTTIIWDNGEYIIYISSNIGESELIDIAKSVQKVE